MTGLILPEILYRVKRKLGCIFIENHNSNPLNLQQGQTKGCVTSCLVKCEEQGQQPEMLKNMTPSVTERSNDVGTSIGDAGVGFAEKAGWMPCVIEQSNAVDTSIGGHSRRDAEKAGSVHSIESRQCFETEVEK